MALLARNDKASQDPDDGRKVVAAVDAQELAAARKDPRVRTFLDDADKYLAALETPSPPPQD